MKKFTQTMKINKLIMIVFTAIIFSLQVTAGTADTIKLVFNAIHGKITVSPVKELYAVGDSITLTAIPNANYTFVTWTDGDGIPLTFDAVIPNPIKWQLDEFNSTFNAIFESNNPCEQKYDLLNKEFGEWQVNKDETGKTSIQIDTAFGTPLPVKVTYNIGKAETADSYDTYAEAAVVLVYDTIMTGFNAINISYKSDKPLFLVLPQPPLDMTGEGYFVDMPASATTLDTTFLIGAFHQPDWTAPANKVPLNLDSILSVVIQPNVDAIPAAVPGSFQITKLNICWSNQIEGIHDINKNTLTEININNLYNNNINITSTKTGNYDISVYSIDGKVVYQSNTLLNAGSNQVQLTSKIENAVYFIRVANDKGSVVRKIISLNN